MTDENEQPIPSRGSHGSGVIERVARDMIAIIRDRACDDDEKDAAAETLVEAICPSPTLTDEERASVKNFLTVGRLYSHEAVAGVLRKLLGESK